jgi:hypothetical protein
VRDRELHPIDDYLAEDWIGEWACQAVCEIEDYLAKHAAFDAFADGNPPPPSA